METPAQTPADAPGDAPSETLAETLVEIEAVSDAPIESSTGILAEPPTQKRAGSRTLIRIGAVVFILVALIAGGFFGYRAYTQGNESRLVRQAEEALASGDLAAAEKAANEALALSPAGFLQKTNTAIALRGKTLAAQQKYTAALPDLDAAIAVFPKDAGLLALRGRAYLAGGQVSQALSDFSASLALDPNQPALLDTQARLALQNGELGTARIAAAAAGRLDATLSLPYAFQAESLYNRFSFSETITAAIRAIQLEDPPALAYRLRGGAYFWLYDFAKARPDLEKALELDPKDAEAAALMALLAAEVYDKEGLETASDLAASIDQDAVPSLLAQAVQANYHHNHSQARSFLDLAITLAPNRPELYIERSNTYTSTLDEAAQQADVEKALSLAPELRTARNARAYWMVYMGEFDEAENIAQQLVDDFPAGEDGYMILSNVYNARYEHTAALEIIEKGLTATGDSAGLYSCRGDTYTLMGKADEARDDFENALLLSPDSAYALGALGYIGYINGDYSVALENLQNALALDPTKVSLYIMRSWVYDSQEQPDKAEDDRRQAAALDAQHRLLVLEEINGLIQENKSDEALNLLDKLAERYPKWPDAQIKRGWIYYTQGEQVPARREAESILKAIPNHPDAHYLLAVIESASGNYEEALSEVFKTLDVQPRNSYAYSLEGDIYWSMGEVDKSESSYQKALEIDPKMYSAYTALGMVHITQGDYNQATKELEKALIGGPNPVADLLLKSLEKLPEGFQLYFNNYWRYILAVPETAEMTSDTNLPIVMVFSAIAEDAFYFTTVMWLEGEAGKVDDPWFFSGVIDENIKRNIPSFTEGELSEFAALETNGVKHPYQMTQQAEGQLIDISGNMYFFSAEGRNMILQFTTTPDLANGLDDQFDQIAGSFAFLP